MFEYYVTNCANNPKSLTQVLNDMVTDKWELHQVVAGPDSDVMLVMKRWKKVETK